MVFVRWLPLLADFDSCKKLLWGSAVLCYTYHCLCRVSDRATTDIAGCAPLMMSWIYQRFPRWCPDERNVVVFPFASRVKRQLGGKQQIPNDPVNLDGFLDVSARGEDQWWPTKHVDWYNEWKGRIEDERQVTITLTAYPAMPTWEYFEWWLDACRVRYLSSQDALDDPRLDDLPDDVSLTASQPRDTLLLPGIVPCTRRRMSTASRFHILYSAFLRML
ncbi:hypothetical protein PIB30_083482 [Stylosanthes scabra]|uniref:Aminotransferase-like plant mobile domain-containing protein n=1 Tax=Stylosanthes scabra TaxID=79078 RepID=A0ABU6RSR7_9FABA|nr:hypothetical protein [Stylosanthes scabra]